VSSSAPSCCSFGFDFAAGVASNANTYPGFYDALDREIFIGLTYRD
jgi:hypothetical protein